MGGASQRLRDGSVCRKSVILDFADGVPVWIDPVVVGGGLGLTAAGRALMEGDWEGPLALSGSIFLRRTAFGSFSLD